METSAKDGVNIHETFTQLISIIVQKRTIKPRLEPRPAEVVTLKAGLQIEPSS
jgi:hypothetical protein